MMAESWLCWSRVSQLWMAESCLCRSRGFTAMDGRILAGFHSYGWQNPGSVGVGVSSCGLQNLGCVSASGVQDCMEVEISVMSLHGLSSF